MSRAAKFLLLVSIQAWFFAGCGESNPLIGDWKDVSDEAIEMEAEGVVVIISFTETSMIMGEPGSAAHIGVDYVVHDDYVVVATDAGSDIQVELEDNDHISMDTPFGRAYLERQ
jgi:hypothetical protein